MHYLVLNACSDQAAHVSHLFVVRWLESQTPLDYVVEVVLVDTVHPHCNVFGQEAQRLHGQR